jgi:hypothetical protein
MSKQPTRRRRATGAAARTVVVGVAVAALVGIVGASQALAGTDERVMQRQGMIDRQAATGRQGLAAGAVPDERVLERQGSIDRQKAAAGQADEQGKAAEPSQGSPTENVRRFIRPEPRMYSEPQFGGDEPVVPAPASTAPAGGGGGLAIPVAVATLLLAIGAATTWRLRHRRPRPDPTGLPERPA